MTNAKDLAARLRRHTSLSELDADDNVALVPRWEVDEAADLIEHQAAEIEALRCVLHEIAEEWAGAECGEPVHAQEAYAIGLAKRMYLLAAAALRPNVADKRLR